MAIFVELPLQTDAIMLADVIDELCIIYINVHLTTAACPVSVCQEVNFYALIEACDWSKQYKWQKLFFGLLQWIKGKVTYSTTRYTILIITPFQDLGGTIYHSPINPLSRLEGSEK